MASGELYRDTAVHPIVHSISFQRKGFPAPTVNNAGYEISWLTGFMRTTLLKGKEVGTWPLTTEFSVCNACLRIAALLLFATRTEW